MSVHAAPVTSSTVVVAVDVGKTSVALSVSDAAEDVIGVIRGGARGYVTKTITGQVKFTFIP